MDNKKQKEHLKKYEKKLDHIMVRLPFGARNVINDYVKNSNKYDSVNQLIRILIEKELGIEF